MCVTQSASVLDDGDAVGSPRHWAGMPYTDCGLVVEVKAPATSVDETARTVVYTGLRTCVGVRANADVGVSEKAWNGRAPVSGGVGVRLSGCKTPAAAGSRSSCATAEGVRLENDKPKAVGASAADAAALALVLAREACEIEGMESMPRWSSSVSSSSLPFSSLPSCSTGERGRGG